MIVYTRDFPSEGYGCTITDLTLTPLTYKQLIDYVNNDELTKLRDHIKDVDLLLTMDPKASDALIIDLDYILYLMKVLTISEEMIFNYTYSCDTCKELHSGKISSRSLIFREIDQQYLDLLSIELGGRTLYFKLTTVSDFKVFVGKLPRNYEDNDIKLIKLASMFWDGVMPPRMLMDLFLNAVGDEIKLVAYLKAAFMDTIKPLTLKCEKGGTTVVTLNDVTTDIFRLLLQNTRLDRSKIHFKQVDEVL